jgi:hypothetical protein
MIISEHPLHRSGRAALPHPAPTSGSDAQALGRIGMADAGVRKPGDQQGPPAAPGQMISLTAPSQHSPPHQAYRSPEGNNRRAIPRDAVVAHVTGSVRLPLGVHRRLRSFDCPTRSADPAITEADGISRFPSKVHPYMRGVSDRAGSRSVLPWRRPRCCLPSFSTASAPRSNPPCGGALISQLNTQPARSPLNASPSPLQTPMHDSGPMWLASPSMYKTFIYNTLPV